MRGWMQLFIQRVTVRGSSFMGSFSVWIGRLYVAEMTSLIL